MAYDSCFSKSPTQNELAKRLPFCYAALLGTHNSGITIADGYGNLDARFQQYFKWIRWVVSLLAFVYRSQQGSASHQILWTTSPNSSSHWHMPAGQQCASAHK